MKQISVESEDVKKTMEDLQGLKDRLEKLAAERKNDGK
jgi:hypothetical protein